MVPGTLITTDGKLVLTVQIEAVLIDIHELISIVNKRLTLNVAVKMTVLGFLEASMVEQRTTRIAGIIAQSQSINTGRSKS